MIKVGNFVKIISKNDGKIYKIIGVFDIGIICNCRLSQGGWVLQRLFNCKDLEVVDCIVAEWIQFNNEI